MSTLLLTGFVPFHTHPVNPSAEAVQALNGEQAGALRVHSALLPVEPRSAMQTLSRLMDELQPSGVLLTGLAAGRPQVTLERVAVNVMDFSIPDNAGGQYQDTPVCTGEDAPAAYLSSLPLRRILAAWHDIGIPGHISNTAGLYVCNVVMYHALHQLHLRGRAEVPCGFLHVPANPQVALSVAGDRPPLPYLPQEEITRAVRTAAQTMAGQNEVCGSQTRKEAPAGLLV
ncbi:pyroglutamyl-peptidase I [Deinococcus deserti]|uniref:Pyroglutamyl-peptidase I n=1 Tax=Deinococcus deserti (strain DSM 17065 / CIP 109153 / LMG 22923 / VCD115) TaxID=546414 RepID=C1CWM6_DEIDV|nr:pyroglutamyl-peptidase I [Deinococcus deserti]ACO46593.1 putative Pyroglutamyl-peptidase I (Pyrrolidone-carboxylate peptidase)(5-oxoprolyl-peptidase) (PGP-I)(PYRase) [Deinococcus deserti VCD115]